MAKKKIPGVAGYEVIRNGQKMSVLETKNGDIVTKTIMEQPKKKSTFSGFFKEETKQQEKLTPYVTKQTPILEKKSDMQKVKEKVKSFLPFKSGGSVGSASKRADGIAQRGKTRGKIC